MPRGLKLKSLADLERFALERGATVELEGRSFNVGQEKVERPAQLEKPAPEKPAAMPAPVQAPAPVPRPESPLPLLQAIAQANARLIGEITKILAASSAPHEWRFKVIRTKNLLIDEIIATPVKH